MSKRELIKTKQCGELWRLVNRATGITCRKYGLPMRDVLNKCKRPRQSQARHVLNNVLVEYIGLSLSDAGRYRNIDHSTVFNSVKRVKRSAVMQEESRQLARELLEKPSEREQEVRLGDDFPRGELEYEDRELVAHYMMGVDYENEPESHHQPWRKPRQPTLFDGAW